MEAAVHAAQHAAATAHDAALTAAQHAAHTAATWVDVYVTPFWDNKVRALSVFLF